MATGFEVRVGALKIMVPRGARRKMFSGISCEKSCFLPILGGRRTLGAPPHGSAPDYTTVTVLLVITKLLVSLEYVRKQKMHYLFHNSYLLFVFKYIYFIFYYCLDLNLFIFLYL